MLNDKEEVFTYLKDGGYFQGLTDFELIRIVGASWIKNYRKDRAVFYQGDTAEAAYLVLSGSVRKTAYRGDSTSLTTGIAQGEDWLGLAETVAGGPYLTDALAREDSFLLAIASAEFVKLLEISNFEKLILKNIARGYYSVHSHIDNNTPRGKIIKFLLAHYESFANGAAGNYSVNITQEDLAEFTGFTRETINKHLKMLAVEGVVNLSRGKIEITDYEGLKEADISAPHL